jgi:hypothetical protein
VRVVGRLVWVVAAFLGADGYIALDLVEGVDVVQAPGGEAMRVGGEHLLGLQLPVMAVGVEQPDAQRDRGNDQSPEQPPPPCLALAHGQEHGDGRQHEQ